MTRHAPADPDSAPWPTSQITAFAVRCRANGVTEKATATLLTAMERAGVRHLDRYTSGWTDRHLQATAAAVEEHAGDHRRGDIIRLRAKAQWPWRTTT